MLPFEIKKNVYWVGMNDTASYLFEGLWPIKCEGISYNSYLIKDDKCAVVDLTKAMMAGEALDRIGEIIDLSQLAYVIINHMEPDHSGALVELRRVAPHVKFVGTKLTRKMLGSFYGITDGIEVVSDGDTLSLGEKTLQFITVPNLHWPETMVTYLVDEQILFTGDAFGGYGRLVGSIYDDDCENIDFFENEARRYYANILASYGKPVANALSKLEKISFSIVAPSHGLIWRGNPHRIVDLYRRWGSYSSGPGELGVTIFYGSMYGNTERMAEAIGRGIVAENVPLAIFDVSKTHVSYILPLLYSQRGVLVGAPTYEGRLFPPVTNVLQIAELKRIYHKKMAYFGSYGWGGGARRQLEQFSESLKWEMVDTMEFPGGPTRENLRNGELFGAQFARQIKAYKRL